MISSSSAARKSAHRIRVQRLLEQRFNSADFSTLLLALREASFGNAIVKEMGDFVAHADIRQKGILTGAVRDFFVVLRHKMRLYNQPGAKYDLNQLPHDFPDSLRVTLRLHSNAALWKSTSLRPKAAAATLESIRAKLVPTSTGGWRLGSRLTEAEWSLLERLANTTIVTPVFTPESVMDGLVFALQKNGLLASDERAKFVRCSDAVMLFLTCLMHGSAVDLGDGTTATLRAAALCAAADQNEPHKLQVLAFGDVPGGKPYVGVGGPILLTSIPLESACDPILIPEVLAASGLFPDHIEIGPDGLIREFQI